MIDVTIIVNNPNTPPIRPGTIIDPIAFRIDRPLTAASEIGALNRTRGAKTTPIETAAVRSTPVLMSHQPFRPGLAPSWERNGRDEMTPAAPAAHRRTQSLLRFTVFRFRIADCWRSDAEYTDLPNTTTRNICK